MGFLKKIFTHTDDNNSPNFSVGDIFYTKADKKYHLYKLLVHDPEDIECYHVLIYGTLDNLPGLTETDGLSVYVYHSPFHRDAFAAATLLANKPVTAGDLIGYHEYLRQTQEPAYYIPIANAYFESGIALTDKKQHNEAIDAYSKAIDLFPDFFEAIDNRAFCKMDLGLWKDAIQDFELSLEQNPNSLLAEFSIGECYYKMAELENARLHFEKAHAIDPNHQAPIQFLNAVNAALNNK